MKNALWAPLQAELDLWSDAGLKARLWLRDDDAVSPSPALSRLADVTERFAVPVLLAVIPLLAEPALAPSLRAMPLLLPCQHGVRHQNHSAQGGKKSEFGAERDPATVAAEITDAAERLRQLFGGSVVPIFVPPWNRIAPTPHAAGLASLGFRALSCFRGYRLGADDGPVLLNTHLDVIDWQGGRVGRRHEALISELTALLEARRLGSAPDAPVGILLHHRDHDDVVWSFLDDLLRLLASHPAISLVDPRALLPDGPFSAAPASGP